MILKEHILFLAIFVISLIGGSSSMASCNRTCGAKLLPYPLGFSAGCPILLNCSSRGEIFVDEFPVLFVTDDTINIHLEAKCDRPVQALQRLFSQNYSPSSLNAILFHNCTTVSPCTIPDIKVETHFESLNNCSKNNISCFSKEVPNGFLDYGNMDQKNQCRYLLSSISLEPSQSSGLSMKIETMKLGWWLTGQCQCSKDAICTELNMTTGGKGFRCRCSKGFDGDGYSTGVGCRKGCNPAKYLSGQCGAAGIPVLIAGIVVGSAIVIGLCLLCCFIRRRSTNPGSTTKRRLDEATGINIPIYPYKEIEKATSSFCDKQRLGTGAYGTVFVGKLHNDSWVAIKRIKNRDTDNIEQVVNEIKLVSSVSHPNLVRLLGCSFENDEQILVYEFMPNGTLCQHLQREKGDGLAWPIRLKIAAETAQAVAHLHSAIDPPIYHRDIKSSNILLDYDFKSKVADFGLSRLGCGTEISHISTAPQGTPGYLDPQYQQNFHLSDRSDVYSFGVVLVEIITALKVVDFSRPQNEVNLAALATDRIGKGRLDEIIDPFLEIHTDAWTLSSVHKVAELAFRCLAFDRDMRPSMMEVAADLEQIRHSQWTTPEEINFTASSEVSFCSSSSKNISEKPPSLMIKKAELENRCLFVLQKASSKFNSMERAKDYSPVSVQDPWLSEQSSPSSSSLLNNALQ